jgi:uncharacterized membrane protein
MTLTTRRRLLKKIDVASVRRAIEAAERRTCGEIRVSLSLFFWGSVRKAAERAFVRLGMTATKDRNAILFFIVPSRRRFVVLGDAGIHAKVGQEFWEKVAASMADDFRTGDFTRGLVRGIEEAGEHLAAHFPYDPATDRNELPDDVDFGGRGG